LKIFIGLIKAGYTSRKTFAGNHVVKILSEIFYLERNFSWNELNAARIISDNNAMLGKVSNSPNLCVQIRTNLLHNEIIQLLQTKNPYRLGKDFYV